MKRWRWKWFYILLGGGVFWTSHILVTYGVGEFACVREGKWFELLGISSTAWGLAVFSLFCLVGAGGALWFSWQLKSKTSPEEIFIGRFGILANLIFFVAIGFQTVPTFILLGDC